MLIVGLGAASTNVLGAGRYRPPAVTHFWWRGSLKQLPEKNGFFITDDCFVGPPAQKGGYFFFWKYKRVATSNLNIERSKFMKYCNRMFEFKHKAYNCYTHGNVILHPPSIITSKNDRQNTELNLPNYWTMFSNSLPVRMHMGTQ